jgi:3-ketosteroid 9alpha-monooxygenase subunit A
MDQLELLNKQSLPRLEDGSVRYPRGWFMLGMSKEFPKGEVQALSYFEKNLVAWRSEQGIMSVWDAYCPHLGAHLGISGHVDGECLVCPMHQARFNIKGDCVGAPRYEPDSLCDKLQANTMPTVEVNGVVLCWHDPRGGAPDYQIESLSEYNKTPWSDWYMSRMHLPVHPREVIDNIADKAHFVYVHGFEQVTEFNNEFHTHMATQHMCGSSERGTNESMATYFGPAYQITWMENQSFESRLLTAHTPIDASNTQLWFGMMLKKQEVDRSQVQLVGEQEQAMQDVIANMSLDELLRAYAESVTIGFKQDVTVWQRKLYRKQPILTDGDGPIAKCRKWYQQFYEDIGNTPFAKSQTKGLNPYISC